MTNTPFDRIPVTFTQETLDMVSAKYIDMQKDGFDSDTLVFSNVLVEARIFAALEAAVEFPDNPDLLLSLAATILAVVDASVGPFNE